MQRATWTDERLTDLSAHLDVRFDHVDERFKLVDKRFDHVDERFTLIDKRFDGIDERLRSVDRRFDRVDGEIRAVRTELRRDLGALQVDLKADIADLRAVFNRALIGIVLCLIGVPATVALA